MRNHLVTLVLNFTTVMVESNQFQSKKDAQHYFDLLDIDKNGNVSFTEFFAPLIPQLEKDQVIGLTSESAYTIEDVSELRNAFNQMLVDGDGERVSIAEYKQHFTSAGGSLKRAFTELMILWPEGDGMITDISKEEFAQLISFLEINMIKKYCLRNYLDSYKESINDFVVNFDAQKTKNKEKAQK